HPRSHRGGRAGAAGGGLMVSRAFKVFLLMVLSFGGLWAYHYRAADLRTWLELGEPPFSGSNELPGLRSPVERVLDPRAAYSVAAVLLVEPPLERAAAPPPEAFVAADLPPAREEEAPPPDVAGSAGAAPPVEPPPAPRVSAEPERPPVAIRFHPQKPPPSLE